MHSANKQPLVEVITAISQEEESSWFNRTFSKLEKNSMRSAIFMMIITSLGTGIFTLHHLFSNVGIFMACFLILVFGVFYFMTSDILIHSFHYSPECTSINELISKTLGPYARTTHDLLLFTFLLLVMIAGVQSISATFYSNFETQIWNFFVSVQPADRTYPNFNFYFCYLVGFLLFFINVKKSFDELRHFSTISLMIFVYIITVCVVQAPANYADLVASHNDVFNYTNFTFNGIIMNYGLLLYSFNCIINFFGVVTTVSEPSIRRLRKIYGRTFIFLASLFIVFGLATYLSLGDINAKDVDLFIFRKTIGSTDYFMQVGRCLLILSLWVSSGLMIYPMKMMIYSSLKRKQTNMNNLLISIIFTIVPVVFASNFTHISTLISVAGLVNVTFTVFTFPGLIAFKVGYVEKKWAKIGLGLWIGILTVLGLIGTILVLFK